MRDDGNLHPEDLKPLLSSKTSLMACTVASNVFFFNDTATTEIYTLSLHDALPIWEVKPEELVQDANDPSYESSYEGADDMRVALSEALEDILCPDPRSQEVRRILKNAGIQRVIHCPMVQEKSKNARGQAIVAQVPDHKARGRLMDEELRRAVELLDEHYPDIRLGWFESPGGSGYLTIKKEVQ